MRLIIIVGLLLVGGWAIRMGARSRPHALKKEPVRILFTRGDWPRELAEPVRTIGSRWLGESIAAAVWVVVGAGILYMRLTEGTGSYLYLIPSLFGAVYNIYLASRRLYVYENAIELRTVFNRQVFFLQDVDCMESYNVVNSFNRGKSFGYQLTRDGEALCRFPNGSYRDLTSLEEIFTEHHPGVERVEGAAGAPA